MVKKITTILFLLIFQISFSQIVKVPVASVKIYTKEDFFNINNNVWGKYELENDIDFNNETITPLKLFSGVFDGKGHVIKNFKIETFSGNAGLFSKLQRGVIRNLSVENATVVGTADVGGLAGEIENSLVENSSFLGDVIGEKSVGGLVGDNDSNSTIRYCYSAGTVNGEENVGGLVGENDKSVIISSYSVSSISGSSEVGGLVGFSKASSSIFSSYSISYVNGKTNIGSLVGKVINLDLVKNSYSIKVNKLNFIDCIDKCYNYIAMTNDKLIKKSLLLDGFDSQTWFIENGSYPMLKSLNLFNQRKLQK